MNERNLVMGNYFYLTNQTYQKNLKILNSSNSWLNYFFCNWVRSALIFDELLKKSLNVTQFLQISSRSGQFWNKIVNGINNNWTLKTRRRKFEMEVIKARQKNDCCSIGDASQQVLLQQRISTVTLSCLWHKNESKLGLCDIKKKIKKSYFSPHADRFRLDFFFHIETKWSFYF